ncbi:MAG: DoxX family protein [Bacteroidota bacterium]|jgi:putative oxidoreductase
MESTNQSKTLNIILWIAQIILAGVFIMAGFMKSTMPIEQLSASLPWAKDVPSWLVRFIGISELLGALGLILPSLFKIKPMLTPLAAAGIIAIMIMAAFFHISRSEFSGVAFTVVLALVAAFIGWGRWKKVFIQVKQ